MWRDGLAQKRLLDSDTVGGVGGLYLQEMIEKDAFRIVANVYGYLRDSRKRTSGGILLVYSGDNDICKYQGDCALVYNAYIKVVSDSSREGQGLPQIVGVSVIRGAALRLARYSD